MKTFEEYLQDIHASTYSNTHDDIGDDYERWLGEKDHDDIMELAEEYGKLMYEKGKEYDEVDEHYKSEGLERLN